jgi:hypothetical protein
MPLVFVDPTGNHDTSTPPHVPHDPDTPPGLEELYQEMQDMCEKCEDAPDKKLECKGRAKRIYQSIVVTWQTNYGHGPELPILDDEVGGYMCWDWAWAWLQIGRKCGGDRIVAQMIKVKKKVPGAKVPAHFFTRFCAGDYKSRKGCCIDVDDGWFISGKFCHSPGSIENHPNWEYDDNQNIPDDRHNPMTPIVYCVDSVALGKKGNDWEEQRGRKGQRRRR